MEPRCFDTFKPILSASERSSKTQQRTLYQEIQKNVQQFATANPVKNNGYQYNKTSKVNPTCDISSGNVVFTSSYEMKADLKTGASSIYPTQVSTPKYESWCGNLYSVDYAKYGVGNPVQIDSSTNIVVDPSYLLFYDKCNYNGLNAPEAWTRIVDLSFQATYFAQAANGVICIVPTVPTCLNLYAATSSGLSKSTDGGTNWTNYTTDNGLGSNSISGVCTVGATIYAATNSGVSKSTDGGTSWTNYTTANGLGSNNVAGLYADGTTIYAATYNGGVSKSTNGGTTWTHSTTGLGSNTVYGVYAVGSTLYAATYNGVSKSTNGGASWTNFTTGLGSNKVNGVYAIGTTIYAATDGGVSKSIDGGTTWTNSTTGLGDNGITGLYAVDTTLYAATYGDDGGVSKSIDGGETWINYTTANGLGSNSLNGVYAVGTTIYAATNGGGGVSKSTDGGENWTHSTTGLGDLYPNGLSSNYVVGECPPPPPPPPPPPTINKQLYVTGSYNVFNSLSENYPMYIYNQDNSSNSVLTLPNEGILTSSYAFLVNYDSSGMTQWATHLGAGGSDLGISLAVDISSNSYVTGLYNSNPFNIYNQDNSTNSVLTLPNEGSEDAFLVKYDPSGMAQWATHLGGAERDIGFSLSVDNTSHTIYIAGSYLSNPLNIYNQDNSTNSVLTLPKAGTKDAFLVKYDEAGLTQWATHLSGNEDFVNTAVDNSSNIYIAGTYVKNVALDVYQQDNSTNSVFSLPSGSTTQAFLVKYDETGVAQWGTHLGGNGDTIVYGVAVDTSNNSYIVGTYYSNPFNIYQQDNSTNSVSTLPIEGGGTNDAFLVKYNSAGMFEWATHLGGDGVNTAFGVAVDYSNNIYVTGYYNSNPFNIYQQDNSTNSVSTLPGGNEAFLVKYDSAGTFLWATHLGGSGTDNVGYGLTVDTSNNLYLTGSYRTNLLNVYDTITNTTVLFTLPFGAAGTSYDFNSFLVKYDSAGVAQWATHMENCNGKQINVM